ncbi:trigger factor [Spirochaetia bacterium]|nr:trigger factor [Spirochaetia bacterium]
MANNVTKEITRLEKSNVKLSLTVPKDEVRSQYQDLLKDYSKNIQLPGFRKGKVPQEVLERKFGESLKGEALGKIIESAVSEVFQDENLSREERPLPYSTPQVQDEPKFDLEQDLTFSVVYDVLPKVTVGQWKGLEVEVPDAGVSDEDLNRELEEVRDRNAIVMDRDEGAVAEKDNVVTVNYSEIGENGEALPNSDRQDFVFTLGSGYNIYKFDDEITGMKKGETREFTKTFPADFEDASLAGQTKKLRVTLTALKQKQLPALDDDLAQDVDEKYKTLDDLKNSIRDRLNKNLERRLKEIKTSRLLEKIMENTPVIIPESMIRVELDGRIRNLARRFNTSAEGVMQMLAQSGDGLENIEKEWRPAAEKALHSRLIVETLIEEQKFEAGDEEVEKELETMAAESGTALEEFKKYYEQDNMKEYLKEDIKERKLFDMLLAENTLKPGKKENYLDLMADNR